MFKWVIQHANADPTGIAVVLANCRSKKFVISALQQIRLECFHARDGIVYQGNLPRAEDGHFTILRGECEVVQFQQNSISLLRLQDLTKRKRWDEVRSLLDQAQSLAHIVAPAGFGELNTLTAVKRSATVKAGPDGCDLLILPKQNFIDCQAAQRFGENSKNGPLPSEAIDFLRQSGLANKISATDLIAAAKSVVKRTLSMGEVLFCKGECVNSIFLVVSGEFALDVSDFKTAAGKYQPFMNCNAENVYHLGAGSILGDEGILGQNGRFESTAVAVTEIAVCFEAVGFGLTFLAERLGASRYCALAYKDLPRWTQSLRFAEQANLYSHFHSLRRSIAQHKPFRGSRNKSFMHDEESAKISDFSESPMMMLHRPVLVDELIEQHRGGENGSGSGHMNNNSLTESSGTSHAPKVGLIQLRGRGKGAMIVSDGIQKVTARTLSSPRRGLTCSNPQNTKNGRPMERGGNTPTGSASRPPSTGAAGTALATVPICGSAVTGKNIVGVSGVTIRALTPSALHHAVELNKVAKRRFHDFFKTSAQVGYHRALIRFT
jgi:CRP-like cAMP-binding protein